MHWKAVCKEPGLEEVKTPPQRDLEWSRSDRVLVYCCLTNVSSRESSQVCITAYRSLPLQSTCEVCAEVWLRKSA